MKEAKSGTFSFKTYKIKSFSLEEPPAGVDELSLRFDINGNFYKSRQEFVMNLKVDVHSKNEHELIVSASMDVLFTFQNHIENKEDFPKFFFGNSMGIAFPYLRSFISTLTFQANIKPIILPIMNLVALESQYYEGVKILD